MKGRGVPWAPGERYEPLPASLRTIAFRWATEASNASTRLTRDVFEAAARHAALQWRLLVRPSIGLVQLGQRLIAHQKPQVRFWWAV